MNDCEKKHIDVKARSHRPLRMNTAWFTHKNVVMREACAFHSWCTRFISVLCALHAEVSAEILGIRDTCGAYAKSVLNCSKIFADESRISNTECISNVRVSCGIHTLFMRDTCADVRDISVIHSQGCFIDIHARFMRYRCVIDTQYMRDTCAIHAGFMRDLNVYFFILVAWNFSEFLLIWCIYAFLTWSMRDTFAFYSLFISDVSAEMWPNMTQKPANELRIDHFMRVSCVFYAWLQCERAFSWYWFRIHCL